jgi:hypothetical protein
LFIKDGFKSLSLRQNQINSLDNPRRRASILLPAYCQLLGFGTPFRLDSSDAQEPNKRLLRTGQSACVGRHRRGHGTGGDLAALGAEPPSEVQSTIVTAHQFVPNRYERAKQAGLVINSIIFRFFL